MPEQHHYDHQLPRGGTSPTSLCFWCHMHCAGGTVHMHCQGCRASDKSNYFGWNFTNTAHTLARREVILLRPAEGKVRIVAWAGNRLWLQPNLIHDPQNWKLESRPPLALGRAKSNAGFVVVPGKSSICVGRELVSSQISLMKQTVIIHLFTR